MRRSPVLHRRKPGGACGFTLMELIVSLAVLGVAAGVMASLFTSSMNLGDKARHARVAAEIAEAQLREISLNPQFFAWNQGVVNEAGLFEITPAAGADADGHRATPPLTVPPDPAAAVRSAGHYERFSWEAHGRLPGENAAYFEVTVAGRWQAGGRPQLVALTGAVERRRVEDAT